jgi:GNAT superfamily N-acetyltransferase
MRHDVLLRPAHLSDARALAAVCRQSWRDRYRRIVPGRVLSIDSLSALERWMRGLLAAPATWGRVAMVERVPVGVAVFRRRPGSRLELFQLFVHPERQRIGAGHALLCDGLDLAARRGMRLELWVVRDNIASRRWYEAHGGRAGRPGRLRWNGSTLPLRLYDWGSGTARTRRPGASWPNRDGKLAGGPFL